MLRDIEAGDFKEEVLSSVKPVILLFWVRSCDQCRRFKPVYENLSSTLGEVAIFLTINILRTLDNLRLAEGMGVEETPTTKIFCRGIEAGSIIGFRTIKEILDEVDAVIKTSPCSGHRISHVKQGFYISVQ